MSNGQDPRAIITPDAFSVAPELLGLPLSRPWRRLVAILIDLALIGLLANAPAVLFAFAAAAMLFTLAYRGRKAGVGSRVGRAAIGCSGAVVVFVAVIAVWASMTVDRETVLFETETAEGESVPVTLGAAMDLLSVFEADDSAEARAAAERIVGRLEGQGISRDQMAAVLEEVADGADAPVVRAVEQAIRQAEPAPDVQSLSVDSLVQAFRTAREAADSVSEAEVGALLGRRLAAAELDARERQIVRLEARSERLQGELSDAEGALEAERNKGPVATIVGFLDQLGLGLGWSGLYFTFLTAFFRGRTPGKRLLGIRVLRLDGGAIGYWVAFERFGGYAASLFTGLEGFFRILWDRNRQCLQDKLAETVVIRETKEVRARLAVAAADRGVSDRPWKGGPVRGT